MLDGKQNQWYCTRCFGVLPCSNSRPERLFFFFLGFLRDISVSSTDTRCLWPSFAHVEAYCSVKMRNKDNLFHVKTTRCIFRSDDSRLYRCRTQLAAVGPHGPGVPPPERESTSLLRQAGPRTPSNHSPAEGNRSKVDVSVSAA